MGAAGQETLGVGRDGGGSVRMERRAWGTRARAGEPGPGGPRAREEQTGDNGRGHWSGEEAVRLELRKGSLLSSGSG